MMTNSSISTIIDDNSLTILLYWSYLDFGNCLQAGHLKGVQLLGADENLHDDSYRKKT